MSLSDDIRGGSSNAPNLATSAALISGQLRRTSLGADDKSPARLAPHNRAGRALRNEKYPVDGPTGAGAGHALGAGRAWLWTCGGAG